MASSNTTESGIHEDLVSFQETPDPFVQMLQKTIDELQVRDDARKFQKTFDRIHQKFPLVNLMEFLELYVEGEYTKELIKRFNLAGYADHKSILQILKISPKRKSTQKGPKAKEINLTDPKLATRYAQVKEKMESVKHHMRETVDRNALRMALTLLLYKNESVFSSARGLSDAIPETLEQFGHVMPRHCGDLLALDRELMAKMTRSILREMEDESLLESDSSGRIRLERHQRRLPQYVLNIVHNRVGITHEKLAVQIRQNLPVMRHMPQAMLLVTLDELVSDYHLVRKAGYWKFRPYFDEYFVFDDYAQLDGHSASKKRKFFGRRISPDDFVKEILALEKGDFEDQDDQVTRIAGMILSRSNMMKHPPNELQEFDFAVDLSKYEFAEKEQKIMREMGLVMSSNNVYVKSMINDKITPKAIEALIALLRDRGRGEQGFLICFSRVNNSVRSILERDKTIQLITREGLTKWCRTTPVIPTRRGAVAVVRQGDHKGDIVKVESVNYESGLADIVLLPNMDAGTQYIGSLEEITLMPRIEKFAAYSGKYFEFLGKLWSISATKKFREVVADGIPASAETKPPVIDATHGRISGDFGKNTRVLVDLSDKPDAYSLEYSTAGLFSCTCLKWRRLNRTEGLCRHLIFVLNEAVKRILSLDDSINARRTEIMLSQIETKMDVFLDRLKYSTAGSDAIRCPSCGVQAVTMVDVKALFGYRRMDPDKKFSLRRQSRCAKCR